MRVGDQRHAPVTIVHEAGWTPAPVWTGAKFLPLPGFSSSIVQPVASRYKVYAIPTPYY
jgi:hypothetical protein